MYETQIQLPVYPAVYVDIFWVGVHEDHEDLNLNILGADKMT